MNTSVPVLLYISTEAVWIYYSYKGQLRLIQAIRIQLMFFFSVEIEIHPLNTCRFVRCVLTFEKRYIFIYLKCLPTYNTQVGVDKMCMCFWVKTGQPFKYGFKLFLRPKRFLYIFCVKFWVFNFLSELKNVDGLFWLLFYSLFSHQSLLYGQTIRMFSYLRVQIFTRQYNLLGQTFDGCHRCHVTGNCKGYYV